MDLIVVVGEQLQPMHLLPVQDPQFRKVLQILVIGEDLDQETSPLKPVAPVLETFHDRKGFLVRDPIILLCWIHGLQHEADQMMVTIGLLLGEDGAIGVVRGISFQVELSIGIHMDKDGGLRDAPLQEFEGYLLILGPLPCLVLLE